MHMTMYLVDEVKWNYKKQTYRIRRFWLSPISAIVAVTGLLGLLTLFVANLFVSEPSPISAAMLLLSLMAIFLADVITGDARIIEISKEVISFGKWRKRIYDATLPIRVELTPMPYWFNLPVVKLTVWVGRHCESFVILNHRPVAEEFAEKFAAVREAVNIGDPTLGSREIPDGFGVLHFLSLRGHVKTAFLPYVQSYLVKMMYLTPGARVGSVTIYAILLYSICRQVFDFFYRPDFMADAPAALLGLFLLLLLSLYLKSENSTYKQVYISKDIIWFEEGKKTEQYDATLPHYFEAVPLPPPHFTPWHKHATLVTFYSNDLPVQTMTIWGVKGQEIFRHLQQADQAAQQTALKECSFRECMVKPDVTLLPAAAASVTDEHVSA